MAFPEAEYRCFVGGLAWGTGEKTLEMAFRPFGEVLEAKVIVDRETGKSRGFGFVTFGSDKAMRSAIQAMNGRELDGRSITVNQAQSRAAAGGGSGRAGGRGGSSARSYDGGGIRTGGGRGNGSAKFGGGFPPSDGGGGGWRRWAT